MKSTLDAQMESVRHETSRIESITKPLLWLGACFAAAGIHSSTCVFTKSAWILSQITFGAMAGVAAAVGGVAFLRRRAIAT